MLGARTVRLVGDSQLLISFMQRRARPGTPFLSKAIREAKQIMR